MTITASTAPGRPDTTDDTITVAPGAAPATTPDGHTDAHRSGTTPPTPGTPPPGGRSWRSGPPTGELAFTGSDPTVR